MATAVFYDVTLQAAYTEAAGPSGISTLRYIPVDSNYRDNRDL